MFSSVPATFALAAAFMASGKDCKTPWSVMAMALCPQAAACLTASAVTVNASILLITVCI
ncbi:secreted protein [gut metagenome]|uniref:Secreted protein n=1 Tax=gut metagenome TaxID=749906 RepID=J9FDD2_9ZZZZ